MNTVPGIYLCQDQTDRQLNLNCSYDNVSAPNEYRRDNLHPEITSQGPCPKYPQYDSLSARLSTFHQWPLLSPGTRQLAQVGFFYVGSGDLTVCYYCGGKLSSWQPNDDPERKHEQLSPRCELVKRENQSHHSGSTQFSSQNEPFTNLNQDQSREDPMKSAAVQTLLEFGYTSEKIKKAIDTFVMQKGKNTFNATELMEVLDCSEDEEESNQESREVESHSEASSLSLMEENQRLRDKTVCKICMDRDSCIVFLPCGHMVCCATCAKDMRKCPKCQKEVSGTVIAFMA